jgi:hypothetical protein
MFLGTQLAIEFSSYERAINAIPGAFAAMIISIVHGWLCVTTPHDVTHRNVATIKGTHSVWRGIS